MITTMGLGSRFPPDRRGPPRGHAESFFPLPPTGARPPPPKRRGPGASSVLLPAIVWTVLTFGTVLTCGNGGNWRDPWAATEG